MSSPLPAHAFAVRARARLYRARLVNELAAGADPHGTPERAVLALQLTNWRHRHELAETLDRLVETSMLPPPPGLRPSPAVPVDQPEVQRARPELIGLADRLRDRSEVAPRGVAMVDELLRNGSSALYVHLYDGDVEAEASQARLALDSV